MKVREKLLFTILFFSEQRRLQEKGILPWRVVAELIGTSLDSASGVTLQQRHIR